jgi:hypothetical protein
MAHAPAAGAVLVGKLDALLAFDHYQVSREEKNGDVQWTVFDKGGSRTLIKIKAEEIRGWDLAGISDACIDQAGLLVTIDGDFSVVVRGGVQVHWFDGRLSEMLIKDMREVHARLAG